jgi:hypothetical protein
MPDETTATRPSPPQKDYRCVNCGRPQSAHPDRKCPGYETEYASMALPAGRTCHDCKYCSWCEKFLGESIAENTKCDWYPVRFALKPTPHTAVVPLF